MSATPLRLAFIGWDAGKTVTYLQQFAQDNRESVAAYDRRAHVIYLLDGTTVVGIVSDRQLRDGRRYDQIIVADDFRMATFAKRAHELNVLYAICGKSLIPPEFTIQHYNLDAPRA